MNEPTVREMLRTEIESLPDALAAEVIDFIVFLKARHGEDAEMWREGEATQRRREEDPAEVRTVTLDEWDAIAGRERDGH